MRSDPWLANDNVPDASASRQRAVAAADVTGALSVLSALHMRTLLHR